MLGNGIEMGLIYCRTLGPLVLVWAPNHFVLGAQLAPDEKRLVCIPVRNYPALKVSQNPSLIWTQVTVTEIQQLLRIV